jgi:hypothetical protein
MPDLSLNSLEGSATETDVSSRILARIGYMISDPINRQQTEWDEVL